MLPWTKLALNNELICKQNLKLIVFSQINQTLDIPMIYLLYNYLLCFISCRCSLQMLDTYNQSIFNPHVYPHVNLYPKDLRPHNSNASPPDLSPSNLTTIIYNLLYHKLVVSNSSMFPFSHIIYSSYIPKSMISNSFSPKYGGL